MKNLKKNVQHRITSKSIQPIDNKTIIPQSTANNITVSVIEVALEEFKTLREEIIARLADQTQFMQLHLTAMTLILGAAFTFQHLAPFLLFLIPIESSIFGLWWMENSIGIMRISRYISHVSTPKLNNLLGKMPVLEWEARMAIIHSRKFEGRFSPFRYLLFFTFTAFSIAALVVTLLLLVVSTPKIDAVLNLSNSLGMVPVFSGNTFILAILFWFLDFVMLCSYCYAYINEKEFAKDIIHAGSEIN